MTDKKKHVYEQENLRLREQLADVKQELVNLQTDTNTQIGALQNELNRADNREGAHIIALRALGIQTEAIKQNAVQFGGIAKDFENFHMGVVGINERLARMEAQLAALANPTVETG